MADRRFLAALLVLALPLPERAGACCPAFPRGAFAQIAAQEIAIVWDPAAKREHFIRRAAFRTGASDFGFLVPTPGVPELGEAPDALFARLGHAIEPERVTRTSLSLDSLLLSPLMLAASRSIPRESVAVKAVRVLLEQRVAGYDAVVLEADDPAALAAWLKDKGYDSRPALVDWAAPYVAAHWKITAFKLALPADGKPAEGARYAVRMSFPTERALFPFRTPVDQSRDGPGRNLLRIFFIGPDRVQGRLGDAPWNPGVPYARRRDDLSALLADALPRGAAPAGGWLTAFEDHAWPRPVTGDLYFGADPGPEIVPPPVILHKSIPIPVELLVGGIGFGLWFRRRRRPAGAKP